MTQHLRQSVFSSVLSISMLSLMFSGAASMANEEKTEAKAVEASVTEETKTESTEKKTEKKAEKKTEKKVQKAAKKIKKSGMEYEVAKKGKAKGKVAKAGDQVSVHYDGKLENGTPFDSSRKRGEPFSFLLGAKQVIAGWDVGVEGMKEGEKRVLYIPSEMAYGDRGVPGAIPPKAKLIFDVELLEVKGH